MNRTINTLLIACPVLLIAVFLAIHCANEKGERLRFEIFESKKGWGYNILVNETIFIHQETIPSFSTNQGFNNSVQATQTAKLVVSKMRAGIFPVIHHSEVARIISSTTDHDQQGKGN